jgi:predicted transposase YbfD/YdcC
VAIDGKTLRRSYDAAAGQSALHLVSAWACDFRLTLGQLAVDDKSNEIPAVRALVQLLDLKGAVVTIDAMHCQKETAQAIRQQEADYILQIKGNQETLLGQVQNLFLAAGEHGFRGVSRHATVDKQPSRRERREYYALPAPEEIAKSWPAAQSIVMIYRERKRGPRTSSETSFALSSLPPEAAKLASYIRNHWGIENTLHWSLDVTFSEDQSRIRRGAGPEVAGFFRRFALSLLKQDTTLRDAVRGKRLRAGWSEQTLQQILLGISRPLKCD